MGSMLGFLLAIYKYCMIPVAILNVCVLKVRDGLCSFVGLNNMLSDEMSDDDGCYQNILELGTLIPIPFLLSHRLLPNRRLIADFLQHKSTNKNQEPPDAFIFSFRRLKKEGWEIFK